MTAQEIVAALGVLGFSGPVPWEDLRRAYRDGLMHTHPDATGREDDGQTSAVVDAFRLLRSATADGTLDLALVLANAVATEVTAAAAASDRDSSGAAGTTSMVRLDANDTTDSVLNRVAAAMAFDGQISGLDHSAGLVQSVITLPGFAPSQLTAEVVSATGANPSVAFGDADGGTEVLFTPDPLGAGEAPPLNEVVRRLSERVDEMQIIPDEQAP